MSVLSCIQVHGICCSESCHHKPHSTSLFVFQSCPGWTGVWQAPASSVSCSSSSSGNLTTASIWTSLSLSEHTTWAFLSRLKACLFMGTIFQQSAEKGHTACCSLLWICNFGENFVVVKYMTSSGSSALCTHHNWQRELRPDEWGVDIDLSTWHFASWMHPFCTVYFILFFFFNTINVNYVFTYWHNIRDFIA